MSRPTRRIVLAGAVTLALSSSSALAGASSQVFLIDFEEYAELTPITLQYAAFGVTFEVEGAPRLAPIIVQEGNPLVGFTGSTNDSPVASGSRALTDPIIGGEMNVGSDLRIRFDPPVTSVRFYLADVDGSETYTATAFADAAVVASITRAGGDPGTGNGSNVEFLLTGEGITSVLLDVDELPVVTGWALDFLTFTRPCEEGSCGKVIRISQESAPGAADFDRHVLGYATATPGNSTPAGFYAYNVPAGDSWNGFALTPLADRSHLLFAETSMGLAFVVVHDRAVPPDPDGGSAEVRLELLDDADGASMPVKDDPGSGDTYTGAAGASIFTARNSWATCCTDGFIVADIDCNAVVLLSFTDVGGPVGGDIIDGLSEWVAYSADGSQIPLALQIDRRVRLEVFPPEGCPADLNCDGVVDGADLGILLANWDGVGAADFDATGAVDGADLGFLLTEWGPCN